MASCLVIRKVTVSWLVLISTEQSMVATMGTVFPLSSRMVTKPSSGLMQWRSGISSSLKRLKLDPAPVSIMALNRLLFFEYDSLKKMNEVSTLIHGLRFLQTPWLNIWRSWTVGVDAIVIIVRGRCRAHRYCEYITYIYVWSGWNTIAFVCGQIIVILDTVFKLIQL